MAEHQAQDLGRALLNCDALGHLLSPQVHSLLYHQLCCWQVQAA